MLTDGCFRHSVMLQVQPQYASRAAWEAFAKREKVTFEAIEFFAPPALNESGRFLDCREWYFSSGCTASLHGAFIDVNPASGDGAFRELSRCRCRQSCELASGIGAKNVVFHSSCCSFLRGGYLENWAAVCADFYEELAETCDLHLFIENSQDLDPEPLCQLMRRIRNPRIGVCLDLGHANYSRMGVEHWFDRLGRWIGYLHLSDNRGLFDDHLALGDGTVDWERANRLW